MDNNEATREVENLKRIITLCLTGLLIAGIPAVSLAAATFSGEIDTGWQGWRQNPSSFITELDPSAVNPGSSAGDYAFGKMVLNGALGEGLTGVLAFKDADRQYSATAANMSNIMVDEASLTFSEDWGLFKLGYFGWNVELQDILPIWTDDIKSQATIAYSAQLTDNLHLGLAFAYTGNGAGTVHDPWINDGTAPVSSIYTRSGSSHSNIIQDTALFSTLFHTTGDVNTAAAYRNAFGANLGFANDRGGGDLLYYHYNDNDSAWGVNTYLQLGDFKPFFEYRNFQSNASKSFPCNPAFSDSVITTQPYTLVNCIVGFTYEPAASPFYMRAEADLYGSGFFAWAWENKLAGIINDTFYCYNAKYTYAGCPWGVRLGYKLNGAAKIEAQYFHTGYDLDTAFWPISIPAYNIDFGNYTVSAPQNQYYLKLICAF